MNLDKISGLFRLDGKVAVVSDSGALSSIDVAPLLAEAGATVVVADRDAEAVDRLVGRIVAQGGSALAFPTDIEDEADVGALFGFVRERFGRLDILVNCAGVTANQPFLEATTEQFDAMISVNLRSVFWLMREGVRLMVERGEGGRIVNVTTMGALHPVLHGNQAYCSARAGVTMLTRTTALDHAKDHILANLVMPGAVMGKVRFHGNTQQAKLNGPVLQGPQRLPLGMGGGADIATAVLYLVGPSGGYITGQSIVLDGGFLAT